MAYFLTSSLVGIAGTVIVFAGGYAMGRNTSDRASAVPAASCKADAQPKTSHAEQWAQAAVPARPAAPLASPAVSLKPADLLATIAALPATADPVDRERLVSRLAKAIGTDAALRQRAVAAYFKGNGGPTSDMLQLALLGSNSPELEKDVVEASRANHPASERLASLQLLGVVGVRTPENRAALLASLQDGSTSDPSLIAATLSALPPPGPISLAEQAAMTAALASHLQSPDATVRQQAINTYVAWAPKDASTVQLLKSAIADPDPDVRSTAISAMAVAASNSADIQQVLLGRMQDESERLGVRQAAATTLSAFPMDSTAMTAHAAFTANHTR